MIKAINTSFIKSLESNTIILVTDDPKTLRIPISFTLVLIVNKARAKSPKQDIIIAIVVPLMTILEKVRSD